MAVTKKPDLSDPVLRAKLAKGMGHNYYGEPAWPNDLLYIFPVVILGTFACLIGLSVLEPTALGEPANPFATPVLQRATRYECRARIDRHRAGRRRSHGTRPDYLQPR